MVLRPVEKVSLMRTLEELKDQLTLQQDTAHDIQCQILNLTYRNIRVREIIKDLKHEIKQAKKQLRREKWQKRFNSQQEIKELIGVRFWPTDKTPNKPLKAKATAKSNPKLGC